MGLVQHLPPPPLRDFVAASYGYLAAPHPSGVHRGLPSRHLTLVVDLNEPLVVSGLASTVRARAVLAGLHTRCAVIEASRPQEGLQYELTPLATLGLLGTAPAALQGQAVDLVDVLGVAGVELLEALNEAQTWDERFRLLDGALLRGLQAADPGALHLQAEVDRAWRLIFEGDGHTRVGDVAADVGWSRRHLTERFRLATGVTPSQAVRVARFEAARRFITQAPSPSLAGAAAICGYADQSHLAREWRSLAGCTMGAWLREELPFLQDNPLLEEADSLT